MGVQHRPHEAARAARAGGVGDICLGTPKLMGCTVRAQHGDTTRTAARCPVTLLTNHTPRFVFFFWSLHIGPENGENSLHACLQNTIPHLG